MVKCDNCGEKLSIEIIKCPKCNAVNDVALLHFKRLAVYDSKFKETIAEVEKHTKEYRKFIWIAMLAAFFAFPVFASLLYMISGSQRARDMSKDLFKKNPDEYYEQVEQCIENGDFSKAAIIIDRAGMVNKADEKLKADYRLISNYEAAKNCIYRMKTANASYYVSDFVDYRNGLTKAIVDANGNDNGKQLSIDFMRQTEELLQWELGFTNEECKDFWFAEDKELKDIIEKKCGGDTE